MRERRVSAGAERGRGCGRIHQRPDPGAASVAAGAGSKIARRSADEQRVRSTGVVGRAALPVGVQLQGAASRKKRQTTARALTATGPRTTRVHQVELQPRRGAKPPAGRLPAPGGAGPTLPPPSLESLLYHRLPRGISAVRMATVNVAYPIASVLCHRTPPDFATDLQRC